MKNKLQKNTITKNQLLQNDTQLIRVLDMEADRVFIIDCIKRTMPVWTDAESIKEYVPCSEDTLQEITNIFLIDLDNVDSENRKTAYERYTMIAPLLPFVSDLKKRKELINSLANMNSVSKQTIRYYLCLYLVYQNISILIRKQSVKESVLSQDAKNMRWALNKFFYTKHKNSLSVAYTLLLKEKYCDSLGNLLPEYPSFYQFRYFYRRTKKMQTYYISRDGLKDYQKNNRPLLGDGIQEYASSVGMGMLDATVCDIYLVNEAGNLVGRPILTACIDAYSSLCCGYSLSWEGGVYSLRGLMLNIISDKQKWCNQYGINIEKSQWDADKLPAIFVTDMGSEYKSENFEQITELGVTVVNLPSYRPELKGAVEKFFDLVQNTYKPHLKGKGVIEPDYQERGSHDYRKDACLTMADFEKVILRCIIYYNSQRIIENFPYTEGMIQNQIQPFASNIWEWGKTQTGANLITVDKEQIVLTLLPRTTGKFSRFGLRVNKMRYKHENFTEKYLAGGEVTVAYNPDDVSEVWLIDNGSYIRFDLIESRYKGKELSDVEILQRGQKELVKAATADRIHQLQGVKICSRHRCYLVDSQVQISGKASPTLIAAETIIPEKCENLLWCQNDTEQRLADYVIKVFQSELDLNCDIMVGKFLHSRMENTIYRSVRGEQRNMSLLHADFQEYYKKLPDNNFSELWQIQKVLTDDRINLYEVYPEEVNEFFKVLFALSDEQTAAMDKVIPMTQELFESCFEKLMSVDAIRSCMKLMEEYPEFTDTMTQNIMNELDLTEEDFQPLSEEESRAGLQALKERIARETGAVI